MILGTSRKGRMSAHAARFVCRELGKRDGVCTELIDIADLDHCLDDNGQGTGDPRFAASMARADGIVIVAPEYNHAMPGLLEQQAHRVCDERVVLRHHDVWEWRHGAQGSE